MDLNPCHQVWKASTQPIVPKLTDLLQFSLIQSKFLLPNLV